MSMMCCSEHAPETGNCSASEHRDIISEAHCSNDIVLDGGDHVCHAMDVGSSDAAADVTMDTSTQDTSTQHVVDSVAAVTDLSDKTAQSGDKVQTGTLVEDDIAQLDGEVQVDGHEADNKATWYFADIKKHWRKFNIDLMPKVNTH